MKLFDVNGGYEAVSLCIAKVCDRAAKGAGKYGDYCPGHVDRKRKGLDMDTEIRARRKAGDPVPQCQWEGCDDPVLAKTLCTVHYGHAYRGTDPGSLWLHKEVSYSGAHARTRDLWGNANQYQCVDCGNDGHAWAYDGTDPTELLHREPTGAVMTYSLYPEFYMPMCRSCHRSRDGARSAQELAAYREWMYRTGFTVADLKFTVLGCGALEAECA